MARKCTEGDEKAGESDFQRSGKHIRTCVTDQLLGSAWPLRLALDETLL